MKAIYKKIGLVATIGYFFGILLIAYLLLSIPQDIKNLTLGQVNVLDQVSPLFNKLNISIAIVLGLGMTSLVLLLFNDRNDTTSQSFFVASKVREEKKSTEEMSENEDGNNEMIVKKIESILSGKEDLTATSNKVLSALCKEFEASQGAIYKAGTEGEKRIIELISSFAYPIADSKRIVFEFGEGLAGQSAKEGKLLNIDSVPDGYIKILSGLGGSSPTNLILVPLVKDENVYGVAEIASFKKFSKKEEDILNRVFSMLANKFVPAVETPPAKKKVNIVQ